MDYVLVAVTFWAIGRYQICGRLVNMAWGLIWVAALWWSLKQRTKVSKTTDQSV